MICPKCKEMITQDLIIPSGLVGIVKCPLCGVQLRVELHECVKIKKPEPTNLGRPFIINKMFKDLSKHGKVPHNIKTEEEGDIKRIRCGYCNEALLEITEKEGGVYHWTMNIASHSGSGCHDNTCNIIHEVMNEIQLLQESLDEAVR